MQDNAVLHNTCNTKCKLQYNAVQFNTVQYNCMYGDSFWTIMKFAILTY